MTLVLACVVIEAIHHVKRRFKEHCLWIQSALQYAHTALAWRCVSDFTRISVTDRLQPSIVAFFNQPHIWKVYGILILAALP
jgi:hypothetical protein